MGTIGPPSHGLTVLFHFDLFVGHRLHLVHLQLAAFQYPNDVIDGGVTTSFVVNEIRIAKSSDGVVQLASGGGGPTSINADTILRLDVGHGGSPSWVQKKE